MRLLILLSIAGWLAPRDDSSVGVEVPCDPVVCAEPAPNTHGSSPGVGVFLLKSHPAEYVIAAVSSAIDRATVSDVATGDFNGDGLADIAVAWFITDFENSANNKRRLSFFWGQAPDRFVFGVELDLFVPLSPPQKSVFFNGTSDIAVGDFDGDGDPDLAVLPFFGDELWLIENLGGGAFAKFAKWMFGTNTTGQFQSPPEAEAADFDGDGRCELVYVPDRINRWDPYLLHFWKTTSSVANMQRALWEHVPDAPGSGYTGTSGLTVADFDRDGRPDVGFTAQDAAVQTPLLIFWTKLNPSAMRFERQHVEYPGFMGADVAYVRPSSLCRPGVVVSDETGQWVEHWAPESCTGEIDFRLADVIGPFAGLAEGRGMVVVPADLDGDGDRDLVTKQNLGGESDLNQVQLAERRRSVAAGWQIVPDTLLSQGCSNDETNPLLRPRNLAVADLFGNRLPEIVAGFGLCPATGPQRELRFKVWANSCTGDVDRDGRVTSADVSVLLSHMACAGSPLYLPDADLDRSGCVDSMDLGIVLSDFSCVCCEDES